MDWGAILKAQSGQNADNERGESLISNCNESADKMISHEQFTLKKEKEDN